MGNGKVSLSLSPLTLSVLPLSFSFLFFFCFSIWSLWTAGFTILDLPFFLDLHVGWLAGLMVHNFGGGPSYKVKGGQVFFF